MGVFQASNILELFHKTGAAGFLGKNQAPLSTKDGPEARGKAISIGRCSSWLIELVYQRKANDGLFYIEGALENQDEQFSPLSYLRLDTGALVSSLTPLTLSSSTRMLLSIPHTLCLPYLRPVCFTQGAVDPKDEFFVRTLERQG